MIILYRLYFVIESLDMTTFTPQNHLMFTDNLIKGRIAEAIFEQMLLESGRFTVMPFGYEKKTPEIATRRRNGELNKNDTIDILKRTPDFVLIDNEFHNVFLVEVKFRSSMPANGMFDDANHIFNTWKPAYLFLATPEGFYFDSVKNIVTNNGEIPKFRESLISHDAQAEYLKILNNHLA